MKLLTTLEENLITKSLANTLRKNYLGLLVVLAIAVSMPFIGGTSLLNALVFSLIFAFPAIGLSLLMGLGGQVSLGHAAFFAIGAYSHVIFVKNLSMPAILAAALAVALSCLVALLVGLPILRLRGHYLALATLGLSFIVMIALSQWEITGKTTGLYGYGRASVFGFQISNTAFFILFITPFVLLALLFALNLASSRQGLALSALNDSEIAAESLGVSTFKLRLKIFVISAGFAAVGGIFYAYHVQVVNTYIASFTLSIQFLLMVVIGGLGSVWGAVIGAFLIELLSTTLRDYIPLLIPGASGEVELIGYGLVLVIVILLLPGGIKDIFDKVGKKLSKKTKGSGSTNVSTSEQQPLDLSFLDNFEISDVKTPIKLANLTKAYGGVVAVNNVSFAIQPGKITGLIGPNGAGKTTCFNMISGAIHPTSGTVEVFGEEVQGKKPNFAANRGLTRTFQNLQTFTSTTVLGNIYMGRYRKGKTGMILGALGFKRKEQAKEMMFSYALLKAFNLQEHWNSRAVDLSFGQQRIMEICRAVAHEPAVLLLDEPMAGLSKNERELLASILRSLRDKGITILLVEHDVAHVMALADEIAVLDKGELIAFGKPGEIQKNQKVITAYLGDDETSDDLEHEAI